MKNYTHREKRGILLLLLLLQLIAEAVAIQWAAQLAISENWRHVILEGDSKICFDSIASKYQSVDWSISAIIDNIHSLVASFAVCSFSWINRSCNSCCCQVISSHLLVSLFYLSKSFPFNNYLFIF